MKYKLILGTDEEGTPFSMLVAKDEYDNDGGGDPYYFLLSGYVVSETHDIEISGGSGMSYLDSVYISQ